MIDSRSMRRIDFVLSNDGHHLAMFEPVIRYIVQDPDILVRVISLCEFRGLSTPVNSIDHPRVRFHRVLPFKFRRASTGGQSDTSVSNLSRQAVRRLGWHILLKRGIEKLLEAEPDLVVLPNDAAFPYERIAGQLGKYRIPFVLVQEGIRFPLPLSEGDSYGKNGATAIAAWGKSSHDFFCNQGVPPERIHLTGSPRFDIVLKTNWKSHAASVREALDLGEKPLLLLTNPIDDQGFCTTAGKLGLVKKFLDEVTPLFGDPAFSLIIKLHGRESVKDYGAVRDLSPHSDRIRILQREGLYPLLSVASASIIFASTVGLESLMFGCPVGVIEIPGHGFAHDFVSSGAALGLRWDGTMAENIRSLYEGEIGRANRGAFYVDRNLSNIGNASERVARVLLNQVGIHTTPCLTI